MAYLVDFSEMSSFTTISRAVDFCKMYYAKYVIAVEKCDDELYKDVKAGESYK